MKKLVLILLPLLVVVGLRAADSPAGELLPAARADAAWLDEARAAYPLTTCLVAGGKLGSMGTPADYVYRVSGQPDRLVRFCCKGCVPKFKKDPARHLARLTPGDKPPGEANSAAPAPQKP